MDNVNLTSADFPNATYIGLSTFFNCRNLETINFPNVITIDQTAFQSNKVQVYNFPKIKFIGFSAFPDGIGNNPKIILGTAHTIPTEIEFVERAFYRNLEDGGRDTL